MYMCINKLVSNHLTSLVYTSFIKALADLTPIHAQKDPRLIAKPLRMMIPRTIPLVRSINKHTSTDPREQASKPTHTPSMERVTRSEQLVIRSLNNSAPKTDQVLPGLMAEMSKLHGVLDDNDGISTTTTPRSPTKPKGSVNVPKKTNVVKATNDPLTPRPPAPRLPAKSRTTVTPKFTAGQHIKAKQLQALATSSTIRCNKVKAKVRKQIGRRNFSKERVLIKVGNPLAVIRDLNSSGVEKNGRNEDMADADKKRKWIDSSPEQKPIPRRTKKGQHTEGAKKQHEETLSKESTISADSETLSASPCPATPVQGEPGNKISSAIVSVHKNTFSIIVIVINLSLIHI